jgi:hypothetical protein
MTSGLRTVQAMPKDILPFCVAEVGRLQQLVGQGPSGRGTQIEWNLPVLLAFAELNLTHDFFLKSRALV